MIAQFCFNMVYWWHQITPFTRFTIKHNPWLPPAAHPKSLREDSLHGGVLPLWPGSIILHEFFFCPISKVLFCKKMTLQLFSRCISYVVTCKHVSQVFYLFKIVLHIFRSTTNYLKSIFTLGPLSHSKFSLIKWLLVILPFHFLPHRPYSNTSHRR